MVNYLKVQNLISGRIQIKEPHQTHYETSYHQEHALLRDSDMHILGELFGLRVVKGCGPGPCIELYVKDDGNYIYKTTIDAGWLKELELVSGTLDKLIKEQ